MKTGELFPPSTPLQEGHETASESSWDSFWFGPSPGPEFLEREKRNAAIHEVGHATTLRHFGYGAKPEIFFNPDSENDPSLKSWLGRTSYCGNLTPLRDRRVSLAGVFAEWIDRDRNLTARELERTLIDALEDGNVLSESDSIGLWPHPTKGDIKAVRSILIRNWKRIEDEVDTLICAGSSNHGPL